MRRNFPALNGLRLFAALIVVSYHYGRLTNSFPDLPSFLRNFLSNGSVALPFFYLLSGFVLTHAYNCRTPVSQKKEGFYLARFARLFPVYLLSFILFLPMAMEKYLLHPSLSVHHGVRTFLMGGGLALFALQAWTPLSQAWNGPGWSLSVEAFFYFLFPFVLPRMVRMRSAPLLGILALLWLSMISLTVAHEHNIISPQVWGSYIVYQPLFWTPLFLLGMATYRLAPRWSQVSGAVATSISVGSFAALVLLCGLPPRTGGDFLVNGGAAPLMALIVLAYSHPASFSSRVMGTRALSFLGGMSYVIYISQAPLWHIFRAVSDKLRHAHGEDTVRDWQFLLYLGLLMGAAFVIQRVVEKPAQHWLLERRKRLAATTNVNSSGIVAV